MQKMQILFTLGFCVGEMWILVTDVDLFLTQTVSVFVLFEGVNQHLIAASLLSSPYFFMLDLSSFSLSSAHCSSPPSSGGPDY